MLPSTLYELIFEFCLSEDLITISTCNKLFYNLLSDNNITWKKRASLEIKRLEKSTNYNNVPKFVFDLRAYGCKKFSFYIRSVISCKHCLKLAFNIRFKKNWLYYPRQIKINSLDGCEKCAGQCDSCKTYYFMTHSYYISHACHDCQAHAHNWGAELVDVWEDWVL